MTTNEFTFDVTVDTFDLEKREVHGRIAPIGQTIERGGRKVGFAAEAFDGVDPTAILLYQHDRHQPIGRMTALTVEDDFAVGTFKVSKTARGDEALQLAADGVLSFSVGIVPKALNEAGLITDLEMPEVSLVSLPAFAGTSVLSVHEAQPKEGSPVEESTVIEGTVEAFDTSALEAQIEALSEQVQRIEFAGAAPATKTEGPTALEWFAAELAATVDGLSTDALEKFADLDVQSGTKGSGDSGGLINEEYLANQLVHVLDGRRPFLTSLGSFPMPQSGYAKIPVVTVNSLVGDRAGQAQDANSRAITTTTLPFEAKWVDGAVRIPVEVLEMADPAILGLYFDDLLAQLADKQEADAIAAVEASSHASADALSYTTYEVFAKAVTAQAMVVRTQTGAPATRLAVPLADWPDVAPFADPNGRRMGEASLTGEAIDLPGGITAFAANVTAPTLYNEAAIRAAVGGPSRVEATNVQKMARDIGLYARHMVVVRIAPGVIVFDGGESSSAGSSSSSS